MIKSMQRVGGLRVVWSLLNKWGAVMMVGGLAALASGCAVVGGDQAVAAPIALKNDNSDLARMNRARSRVELASAYLADGNPAIALSEARKAVAIEPELADAHGVLALALDQLGDKGSAKVSYEQAIRLDPENIDIKSNYGMMVCDAGHVPTGLDLITYGLSQPLYPRKVKLMQMAGVCALKNGHKAVAEQWFKKAMAAEPSNVFSALQLFEIFLQENRLSEARTLLTTLKAHNETTPQWLLLTARLEQKAGSTAAASRAVALLMERFPESVEASTAKLGIKNE